MNEQLVDFVESFIRKESGVAYVVCRPGEEVFAREDIFSIFKYLAPDYVPIDVFDLSMKVYEKVCGEYGDYDDEGYLKNLLAVELKKEIEVNISSITNANFAFIYNVSSAIATFWGISAFLRCLTTLDKKLLVLVPYEGEGYTSSLDMGARFLYKR